MDKKTLIDVITKEMEQRKVNGRERFLSRAFVNPEDDSDGEMTLNGAQMVVVLSDIVNIKYKFYKVDEDLLKNNNRQKLIKNLKAQYPGIIFFICKEEIAEDSPKTIDTENNMVIVDNNDFDMAVELCDGINKYINTILQ